MFQCQLCTQLFCSYCIPYRLHHTCTHTHTLHHRAQFDQNLEALVESADFCVFDHAQGPGAHALGGIFVASDSQRLKSLLRKKYEERYSINYFDSPGDRLKADRGSPITPSQFITLIEFWLMSVSRNLVAMAFFDRSLFSSATSNNGKSVVVKAQSGESNDAHAVSTFAKVSPRRCYCGYSINALTFCMCALSVKQGRGLPGRPGCYCCILFLRIA